MVALGRPRGMRFALGVLLGAGATGAGVALLAVSAWMLARAAQHPPVVALSLAAVTVRALGVGRGVFRYLERLVTHDAALRTLSAVRVRVYRRLARTEPLRAFRGGDLVSRLVSDVDSAQDLLVRGLAPPLIALLAGGGAVALCATLYGPSGALLALGLVLAGLLIPLLSAAAGRRPGARLAPARGELSTGVTDLLAGAPDLVAYGAMDAAVGRVRKADARLTRIARQDAALLGFGEGASAALAGLTVWAILLLGVAAVDGGTLGAVPLAVVVLTGLAAFEVVAPLPPVAARLGAIRSGAVRLFAVLDLPPAVHDPDDPAPVPEGPVSVTVRGLRVRYGPDEPWALDGVDLDLSPGRRVAVVGPSGAGKSTLAAVLFRFRDPDAGTVLLSGTPLTDHTVDDARAVIGGMPQDPHVFTSTLRENLRLARPGCPDGDLWEVLDRVRLGDWVRSLPDGLSTEVGTDGTGMSGGQRQRLALARALLAAPRVLVLDEPTVHLDPDARRALTADLLDVTRGDTVLIITHDLDGLQHVDEIVVLVDGKVRERGTHTELLAAGGWYASAHTLLDT
ncbi:MAG: thiol reductant ABC exporter subunit CydC [Streptosporangiales bacterium]|nr:thiol reductant ABC exporter subunit CydC [Streptosporangiales bacterium]